MPVGIKILLDALLFGVGGPLFITFKAAGFLWQIEKATWERMSHKQRAVEGVLVPVWFGVIVCRSK